MITSRSQAGQDLFVAAVLNNRRDGIFIDVGCSHPIEWSNTYALEQELGWRGLLLDADQASIHLCRANRKSIAVCADARTFDWPKVHSITGSVVDYASVDVDEHTHETLKNLLACGPMIRVMTLEHDQYQRGDRLRGPNRALMAERGFELIAGDVHSNGCCYEDWYVRPELVDMALVEPFRSAGMDWAEVLRKGGLEV